MSHFNNVSFVATLAVTSSTVDQFKQQLVNLGYEVTYRDCGGFDAAKYENFFGISRQVGGFFKLEDGYLKFELLEWQEADTRQAIALAFANVSVAQLVEASRSAKVKVDIVPVNVTDGR